MKINLVIGSLLLVFYASCNQQTKSADSAKESENAPEAQIQIEDQKIEKVYSEYIKVKDALVLSDSEKAKQAGNDLAEALKDVEGCENAAGLARKIASVADLTAQRKEFTLLNADLIPLIKETQINAGSVFMQYCPMANDGDGGYWLASESEIKNPYYGDEMLNCGEVKEEFKATKK